MEYGMRKAELDDLDVLQEMSVKLSEKEAEEFDSTIDPEWNTADEATEYFKQRIQGEEGFAIVAEEEQQIIGYAVGGIRDAEEYREDLQLAELETMYVRPEYRSKGVGSQFMHKFENWAENNEADRLRVEVTSQNERGIEFYQNNGLEDYARIMEKEL